MWLSAVPYPRFFLLGGGWGSVGLDGMGDCFQGRVMGDVRQFCAKTLEAFDVSIAREFDTIVQVCTRRAGRGGERKRQRWKLPRRGGRGKIRWWRRRRRKNRRAKWGGRESAGCVVIGVELRLFVSLIPRFACFSLFVVSSVPVQHAKTSRQVGRQVTG